MNYLTLDHKDKLAMQKLMLHHFSDMAIAEGLTDDEARDYIESEMIIFEKAEKYEECALYRDVLKIWDELND